MSLSDAVLCRMKKGIRRFRSSHLECSTVKDPKCMVPIVQFSGDISVVVVKAVKADVICCM